MLKFKKFFSCLLCAMMVFGLSKVPTFALEGTATGTQKAYIVGDDWGPAVTKTVINLNKTIASESVTKDKFIVSEEKNTTVNWGTGEIGIVTNPRTVTAAYTSDANGNKTTSASNYVTVEMYVSPSEGSPFIYSLLTGFNSWCNPYKLHVSLASGETLVAGSETIATLDVTPEIDVAGDGKICPQGEVVTMKSYTAKDGTTYSYADYAPAKDDKKNALVIWLHGAGEGGSDPYIDILGNEVNLKGHMLLHHKVQLCGWMMERVLIKMVIKVQCMLRVYLK